MSQMPTYSCSKCGKGKAAFLFSPAEAAKRKADRHGLCCRCVSAQNKNSKSMRAKGFEWRTNNALFLPGSTPWRVIE